MVATSNPEPSYERLPPDLPVPHDDGAADHLPGQALPPLTLRATTGRLVELAHLGDPLAVVYVYPMTGRPGVPLPAGWNEIPGARGCTPESLGFRDRLTVLGELGAEVFGLSSQDTDYQREAANRLELSFALLSDPELALAGQLGLPTFEAGGMRLYRRLTLVVRDGRIEHVFYPVFPPDAHAGEVVAWLQAGGGRTGAAGGTDQPG